MKEKIMNNDNKQEEINASTSSALNEKLDQKKLKKPLVKKIFIGLGILLGILVLLFIIGILSDDSSNKDSLYSENQMRVIKNFGKPQTFKYVTNEDETLEYWRYIYLDEVFVFQNGEFIATQHYNFDIEDDEGIYLELEPADFYNTYIIEDVNELLETEPTLSAEIDEGILGAGYKFYSYGKLLDVTVHEGFIQAVDTVAYLKNSEVVTDNSNNTNTEEKGKVFVGAANLEDSSFSYYLDNEKFRYIKQRNLIVEDFDTAYETYGYCYTLDEGESFSDTPQDPYACADNESMLWTIEMYTLDAYKNLDTFDKDYYEELARNNTYVYVVSHANGDFPSALPSWKDILSEIKSSFSVPMAQKYYDQLNN